MNKVWVAIEAQEHLDFGPSGVHTAMSDGVTFVQAAWAVALPPRAATRQPQRAARLAPAPRLPPS